MVSSHRTPTTKSGDDVGGGGGKEWSEGESIGTGQHLFYPPPRRRTHHHRISPIAIITVIISYAHLISGSSEFSDKDLHLNQNLISPVSSFADSSSSQHHYHYHQSPHFQPKDNTLKFQYSTYNVTIPENSIGKTRVQQLTSDLGKLGISVANGETVQYRILEGDKDKIFKIEEQKVGDFSFLNIRTRTGNVVLNREKVDEYYIKIKAVVTIPAASNTSSNNKFYNYSYNNRDFKSSKVESQTTVYVKVLDKNDLNPSFYPVEYSVTIPEDMELHKSVLRVQADDADLGINGEIYYSFLNKQLLELDRFDSNGDDSDTVSEQQTSPFHLNAKSLEYRDLFSGSLGQFSIHPITGVISLTRPLKFSESSFHDLVVVATDRGGVPPTTTHHHAQNGGRSNSGILQRINQASKAKVRINVTQVNLFTPIIYVQSLPEILEESNTHIFGIVRVEDMDVGVHGQIGGLEIVDGDPNGHFRIRATPRLGEFNIEVHHLLDRESTPNGYNLTLRATDRGIPQRETYKVIPVHLADKNDNAPIFNRAIYDVSVPESAPPNSPIIRLKVADLDEGKNGKVFLEIVGGNEGGEFRINADTGMLYTTMLLDAETKSSYILTVSAIDQGNTGTRKQSSARVKITVDDINDNDPVFDQTNMTIEINENEPAGTTVTKVSARDQDSGENAYISYSIANLNDVPFDIDHFSGIIRTSKLIDFETMRRQYVLKVRASDWGLPYRRQTEMQIFINLKDVNDNRPQFERVDCIGQVNRQAPIGSDILTVSAIDYDAGNSITYRMISGNDDGCFNLDPSTGIISVGCDLSDVRMEGREINITATDGTHFADVMHIQINLTNNSLKTRINPHSTSQNFPFGRIGATSLSNSEDNNSLFECRDTGVTRRQAEIFANAERNNMPSSTLLSNGQNKADSSDDFAMMPSRYGENIHAPELIDFPTEVKVNETVALGTTITWIRARDRDLGYNGKLVYGISDGDNDSVFRIDPETGELKIIGYLDRERQDEYNLNITVYDLGKPQKTISNMLPVTVLDENDNRPKFEKSVLSFRVPENVMNGTVIVRMNATDADTKPFATIRYFLLSDTNDFAIDRDSGVISVSDKLDRERTEVYELKIRATDGGEAVDGVDFHKSIAAAPQRNQRLQNQRISFPPYESNVLYSDAIVRITVDDINDNAPAFSMDRYGVRVREDVPVGSVITVITATDLDLGAGGEVVYRFSGTKCEGESDGLFAIDKFSGTIRLVRVLDFEERQLHTLCVEASDRGNPSLTADTTVLVEVIDVNENRYAPQFDDFVLVGSVLENQPIGTYVMLITAKDNDPPGPDSRISYSVRGGHGLGMFTVDGDGTLRTAAILDVESTPHYWLTICAQDHGVVPLHSCAQVFIEVLNENDNAPLPDEVVYYASVPEGSSAGVKVVQLEAYDYDVDPLQRISYKIVSGNPESYFHINSSTGLITTTGRKLDRELQDEHDLEVMISDDGTPQLSLTARVIVSVEDINDHSPEFDQKFYKAQIPANTKNDEKIFQDHQHDWVGVGGRYTELFDDDGDTASWESFHRSELIDLKSIFRVFAYDRDVGENGRIMYSMKAGKGKQKFRIDSATGTLYAIAQLEPGNEFNFVVRAEDNGVPKRQKTARVNLIVVDVPTSSSVEDDVGHAPMVKNLDQHVEVTELDMPGFLVSVIQGVDEDDGLLWYDIVHGDERNEFFIGRDNGNVLLAKQLDWETQKEYNLTISVSDGSHITYTNLYVSVLDVNDNRPEFPESTFKVDISENVDVGTVILQLRASDKDEDKKLFYNLHGARSPVSLQLFHVDVMTGNVVLTKRLDRELMNEHILIVKVRDQGTRSKSNFAKIEITVHDHNDHAPEFMAKLMQGKVYESAAVGSMVLQIIATDQDLGENGRITYSIVGGNVGNVFRIDSQLGFLTVNKELDIQTSSEFILQIKATDNGKDKLSSQIPVHIMVNMADNAKPRFIKPETTAEIYENSLFGTFVALIEARSTSSLYYEIVDGNEDSAFFVNPSVGMLAANQNIDFERRRFYNLTIRVTNMASVSATCQVYVHVLDRNDNAPQFEQDQFYGNISESAPIGSLVIRTSNEKSNSTSSSGNNEPLVIRAFDVDSGINALLHYEIVEVLQRRFFHIDSTTGAIKTVMLLDHEKMPVFNFHVRVSDLGQPRLSSETMAKIKIYVSDVNDCPPTFTQSEYNVTLLLPTYENVVVIQVNATDADSDASAITKLRFDIIDGNVDNVFNIDADLGVITTRNVDKIGPSYRLQVRVSDGIFSKTAHININVETSENSGLIFQKTVYEGSILENSTKIASVAIVNVLGSMLNEHIEFRILNPTDMFQIGLTSGVIKTTGKIFDREIQDNYKLIVEARSEQLEGEKPRIAHVIVNVTIIDVNDNSPMFVNLPYYAVVSVDDPKGSVITKVHAVDLDSHENGEVRYEMKRGYGELFRVDRQTGEVTLKQTLEGHNRDYELLIAAYDGGVQPCSSDVTVHVKVIDKSMPMFGKQFYSDNIPENVELYSPLSVAIQAESPLGRKLIYTIVDGNDLEKFAIDFNTGAIYVVDELDFEAVPNYALTVRATDSISGVSAEVPVSILVQDINDCPPEIDQDNYHVSVSESALFGTPILKVTATDNDTGVNSEFHYAIETENRNSSEFFHMDPNEGVVYLKKSLDHESRRLHHFVVVVSDKGMPSLSSKAHVWVKVIDMNDNPPKFEQSSYSCMLSKHVTRDQFVTVVTASDPDESDHDNLVYAIAHGNELQTYSIDSKTGIIRVSNMQSPEDHFTVLNVSVTDGVYTSFVRVKINILPANLNSPVFTQQIYDVEIDENQLQGRLVTTVQATDADFGEYATVRYDIFSETMKEMFTIDNEKGDITTKVRLDREKRKEYDIPIIATDAGGRSGFATVKVHVKDENDNSPVFRLREYKAVIHSNLAPGSVFIKLVASDPDDNTNADIKYEIYDSQNAGVRDVFAIDDKSGALTLKKSAKQWENQLFQFFIRASDNGSPSLHSDVPIDVYVMSPGEQAPVFEEKAKDLFIPEHALQGTLISRVNLVNPNVTYNLRIIPPFDDQQNAETPLFTVNSIGELRLAGNLDREKQDIHYIGIVAQTDSSPPLTALFELALHVQDENDNEPQFESNSYELFVAENVERESTLLKVIAYDDDIGNSGDIRYSFDNSIVELANVFNIDEYTGVVTLLSPLDREKKSEYQFQVLATDQGQPKLTTRTNVLLRIKDYNDSPPMFQKEAYEAEISEDSLPGTVVTKFSIKDRDVGKATPIEYYILSGDTFSQFQIRQTGELFVVKGLDREEIEQYTLEILATDGRFSASTNVTIKVTDVNDNPPVCSKYRYQKHVSEGIGLNAHVLVIEATDLDEPENSKFRFYLTGDGSDDFSINKETGEMKIAKLLDREKISKYNLVAHVQDKDHPAWKCLSEIVITVTDLNDNPPVFSMDTYSVGLSEDVEIGTLVTKVHASDADVGTNRKILYHFVESVKEHFKIVPESGIITLMKPLDRETRAQYNLTVMAIDQGEPQLSSSARIIVNVQDINDNPPEFTSKHYFASIPEITPVKSEILRVLATSKDSGINAEVNYSIINGNEQKKFTIDIVTGAILVIDVLDYERSKDYFLTVQAIDKGIPPLSNLATVNISITDSNDNAPIFSQTSYMARIREDAQVKDKIIQVVANDLDSDDNGKVAYKIERGDRLNQFTIEEDTGYIAVASELDRESISNYVLEISGRDHGNPVLSSYVLVNIEVSDANDNPPLFSEKNYTAVVQEDKAIGYVVLKFNVTDQDMLPNGAPYTFDIRSGNEMGAFRLEQDGVLRTATKFNHKVCDSYTLEIRVFDNGTPPLYSDTFVIVKVIEESQYPPIIIPLEITINSYKDDYKGGEIGKIFATDQDQYDVLIYKIAPTPGLSYSAQNLFEISEHSGVLSALSNLDLGEYKVNVSVSDGKFISHTIVKVNVELVSEEMLKHGAIVRFNKVTPAEFILSHKKQFIRAIRNAMGNRLKDIVIISIQEAARDDDQNSIQSDAALRFKRASKLYANENNLDVLFTVRKFHQSDSQQSGNNPGFHSRDDIYKVIEENIDEIEDLTKLTIDEIVKTKCDATICGANGDCEDTILIDQGPLISVSIDVTSFVTSRFVHKTDCKCREGFGGDYCTDHVNECAKNPCPKSKVCIPTISNEYGFECICPDGFTGPACNKDISKCNNDACYIPKKPISFSGKSFAQYRIDNKHAKDKVEDQFALSLHIRTVQLSGNLLFSSGKIDYNILEISNGALQYRFDLGSGEGMVSVASIFISDGQWHEIKLDRKGNSAKLNVDHKHTAQGSAPGVNGVLNVQTNDLYFGAEVRDHPRVIGFEDVQRGFIGCMDQIMISDELIPLHKTNTGGSFAALQRFTNVDFSCDTNVTLKPVGICGNYPCSNGGTCKELGNGNFECHCHTRFSGAFCKEDLDPCSSAPCLYGGTCQIVANGNFSCECPPRMTGKRCEYGRFCSPNPCRNGGICEEGDSGPLCMCRGYMGPTCEIDIDECLNMPCDNGATCINEPGSFRCNCPPDLTGSNCGDPMYSNSIRSKYFETSYLVMGVVVVVCFLVLIVSLIGVICHCKKERKKRRMSPNNVTHNFDSRKDNLLNPTDYNNRQSKMSNLDVVNQNPRPASYAANGANDQVPFNNAVFVNNLDTLRSYGSAGDELENVVQEYTKHPNQQKFVNLNTNNTNGNLNDSDSHKQNIHMQTFDSKNSMESKRMSPMMVDMPSKMPLLKSSGILPGRLNPSTKHSNNMSNNQSNHSNYDDSTYHWDCSDWVRRSQNPLPNISVVPGNEVADTSSFHSNESNESQPMLSKANIQPMVFMVPQGVASTVVDPARDIDTLNEELESSDYMRDDSEFENFNRANLNANRFENNDSINYLNQLESGSEDYRFDKENLSRYPDGYLLRYNIQSETDYESERTPLNGNSKGFHNKKLNSGPLNSNLMDSDNDEDDGIQSYGFPAQPRLKTRGRDMDLAITDEGECHSLLSSNGGVVGGGGGGGGNRGRRDSVVSNRSVQLCEIEDSEFETNEPPSNPNKSK